MIENRIYTPYYDYNPFTVEDEKEIKNFIDYAKSLVIFNKDYADALESKNSSEKSAKYLDAILGIGNMSPGQAALIISKYVEFNQYYDYLKKEHNIPYEKSRTAKNFEILKTNKNILNQEDENLFLESYDESLEYFLNVTYTKAFSNQSFEREFHLELLMFMTFLKYSNKKMELYFDIDRYDKNKLKNSFISNGLDYFDTLPVSYQKRILKKINQLIRQKATNQDFIDILNIFSFNNITINKFILTKTNNNLNEANRLVFYKVPIDDNLDINNHQMISFNTIINKDPYWRATEQDLINEHFNAVNSKYISIDTEINILEDTISLSYLMNLLNDIECYNKQIALNLNETEYNKSYNELRNDNSITDLNFIYYDRNISNNGIRIYDSILALIYLVLTRTKIGDSLSSVKNKNFLTNIYGFRNIWNHRDEKSLDDNNSIDKYYDILYYYKKYYNKNTWKKTKEFLNKFNFHTLTSKNDYDFNNILNLYNSSPVYENQLNYFIELVEYKYNDKHLRNFKENDDFYQLFRYIIYCYVNNIYKFSDTLQAYDDISYEDLKKLLRMYLIFRIDSGEYTEDELLLKLFNNNDIIKDLEKYKDKIIELSNFNMINDLYNIFITNKNYKTFSILINECKNQAEKYKDSIDYYDIYHNIDYYTELTNFIDVFYNLSDYKKNTKISLDDFIEVFKFNNNLRKEITNLMKNNTNNDEYELYKKLFNNNFISDYSLFMLKNPYSNETYNSYLDYIEDNNIDLYNFITPTQIERNEYILNPKKYDDYYILKIFELAESIDNALLGLKEDYFLNNNFIGILDFIKEYIQILVTVFKSFTIQIIDTSNIIRLDDDAFNKINLRDSLKISKEKFIINDGISLSDNYGMNIKMIIEEFNIQENLKDIIDKFN